jgi:hypothetical protein
MLSADETIDKIQNSLNNLKRQFLRVDYDDLTMGYIVEDIIYQIQDQINEYKNREFKHLQPDPFA